MWEILFLFGAVILAIVLTLPEVNPLRKGSKGSFFYKMLLDSIMDLLGFKIIGFYSQLQSILPQSNYNVCKAKLTQTAMF